MSTEFDELRSLGFNLIPIPTKTKIPVIKWKEFQTTKCTLPLPENAAVVCGETSGNLVVIDVDSPEIITRIFNDWEGIKRSTLVVKTGSGGYHVYCRPKGLLPRTVRLDGEVRGQHVDIQALGVYVLAPGSVHPNGNKYEIISSTKNIELIDIAALVQKLGTIGFKASTSISMETIAKGGLIKGSKNRNDSLYRYSLHLMDEVGLDESTAWERIQDWNKSNLPPIPSSELKATFNSALQRVMRDVKPVEQPKVEQLHPNFKRIREVSSEDEGIEVSFDALVGAINEYRTVTTHMTALCPNCQAEEDVDSEGYVNPRLPKCLKCKVNMIQKSIDATTDMREIILQEFVEEVENNNPSRLNARVIGKDVFNILMGKKVRVVGKFKSFSERGMWNNEVAILVKSIIPLEERADTIMTPEEILKVKTDITPTFIHDKLIPSFAPDIYGLEGIKECLLLAAVAGYKTPSMRGDINMMIIGNPSKGKSVMLKFFTEVTPKSSYVNAGMSSAAGLVYGMVKLSNGTSIPQAGPVVLNSGGFVCCDELDKAGKPVHDSLLEVMEQQSVSFAKAGVNATMTVETAIISAANPKDGKWDFSEKPMKNINLPQPLVSRNDWIWGIIKTNQVQRGMVADRIFNKFKGECDCYFNKLQLKHFLNYARRLEPQLNEAAYKKLRAFYMDTMQLIEDEGLPFEERQLEGLIRSSIARAKLLLKDEVEVTDAEAIIDLYKQSLQSLGLKVEGNMVQSVFEDDKANKDTSFRKAWYSVATDNGLVDQQVLFTTLQERYPKHFPDIYSCKNYWKSKVEEDARLQPDGRYKMKG